MKRQDRLSTHNRTIGLAQVERRQCYEEVTCDKSESDYNVLLLLSDCMH